MTQCERKRNFTVIRYNFNTRNQRTGERFESYYTELRSTVKKFGSLEDNLLHDGLVCDIIDEIVSKNLLQVKDSTLKKCVNMCRVKCKAINNSSIKSSRTSVIEKNEVVQQDWSKTLSSKQVLVEK